MNFSSINLRSMSAYFLLALLSMSGFVGSSFALEEDFVQKEDGKAKQVVGWLENMRIYPGGMIMRAKLDSGARSNAMHAENLELFERDGVEMASFTILKDHDNPNSESVRIEVPVEKQVNIKLRYTPVRDARPVVKLEFCMAGQRYSALFSLTYRSDFNYPVLLGREFLKDHFLVDPSDTFTQRTGCRRD
jgi:hypothetical protein